MWSGVEVSCWMGEEGRWEVRRWSLEHGVWWEVRGRYVV